MSISLAFATKREVDQSPSPVNERYSLLALTPSLLALLSDPATENSLEIRGHTSDFAVLVTEHQTHTIRGVQNSNSLLLCERGWKGFQDGDQLSETEDPVEERAPKRRRTAVKITATLHETLEVVQGAARTDKLESLLKGCEYLGEDGEEERNPSVKYYTFEDLKSLLPASNSEIKMALKKLRVIEYGGVLRPVPPSFLLKVLPELLSCLPCDSFGLDTVKEEVTRNGIAPTTADKPASESKQGGPSQKISQIRVDDLFETMESADCGTEAAQEILGWYGNPIDLRTSRWEVEIDTIVRDVGLSLLARGSASAKHAYAPQPLEGFLDEWKLLCNQYSTLCDLHLLSGAHLISSQQLPTTITYFPVSRLSSDASTRFTELFAVKPRWEEVEMTQFLDDLVGGDKKKRDAMVLKFVRKVKDKNKMVWTARNLW